MAEGYQVDTRRLRELAAGIQAVSEALQARRLHATGAPDAGCSSGELAQALRHLGRAGADLTQLCRAPAERLVESARAYDHAEAVAQAELARIARVGDHSGRSVALQVSNTSLLAAPAGPGASAEIPDLQVRNVPPCDDDHPVSIQPPPTDRPAGIDHVCRDVRYE